MSQSDRPLPTKTRRRSIFDDHSESRQKENNATLNIPTQPSEVNYPPEYVEKIRTEIHLWKTHIKRSLEDLYKLKAEKREARQTTVNESILSPEQSNLLASFEFEKYVQRAQKFCDRASIIAHKIQYRSEDANSKANELLAVQNMLEKEILKNHSNSEV